MLAMNRHDRGGLRVLMVRGDHLGDVLLTLPAAIYLRRLAPDALITYAVSPALVELVRRCPAVDDCVGLPFPEPGAGSVPTELWAAVRYCGRDLADYDAALLLRPSDPVAGELVARLGVPVRIGFAQPHTVPFLTRVVREPRGHHARLGYDLADALTDELRLPNATPPGADAVAIAEDLVRHGPPLRLRAPDQREARSLLDDLGAASGEFPVVLHPGSGWVLKNWPPQRWGRLARIVSERHDTIPLVSGTRADEALAREVVDASRGRAVSVAGRLSLEGFAALLARSRILAAVDSGPVHLAALMGSPVVAIYGPGGASESGPIAPAGRSRALYRPLRCQPCGRMVHPPCGALREPACVTGVTVEEVAAALDELFS
jgi:ADP-heptose:LPS heptosyltransferase